MYQYTGCIFLAINLFLGPVVQNIVSVTSSLVVKLLIVLVSTISNSQVFLLKKVSSFCKCKSYSHFFSKNISVYVILVFNDQKFNDTLTASLVLINRALIFYFSSGVIHGAELFYLSGCPFTGHKNFRYNHTDRDIATTLILLWANFIKYGYVVSHIRLEQSLEHLLTSVCSFTA